MNTVLVTGANGFVGSHLVKELLEAGFDVIGVGGQTGLQDMPKRISSYQVLDLNNPEHVRLINFLKVDHVIHLAGLASVGASFDNPMDYINTNIGIEVNLFETAIAQKAKPTFLIVSTGNLYEAGSKMPLTETSPILPTSPYTVSKIGQEQTANYYRTRGFECLIARPFNHIGPGQNLGFLVPDLAKQIIDIKRSKKTDVLVGNLDAKRDYSDVRDIARAYRLLLEKGVDGEIYNICSGEARSGHEMLKALLDISGVKAKIKLDTRKVRPSDIPIIYGDNSKITKRTGWKPTVSLETTLEDVLRDWESRD